MSDLKPCPFCGSENIKHHHYSNQPYQQYIVRCKNCGARVIKASLELAFEAWNRRAEPEERTAKVEHKSDTYVVTLPKSTTTSYETRTNLWEECGNCHAMGMYHGWNYCPSCGARLEWE